MDVIFQGEAVDLEKIVRLYPAAIITLPEGETVQVSLEWAEAKFDQINVTGFVLIFDYGTSENEEKLKKEFFYHTFDKLEEALREVALLIPAKG